ncbi:MAG: hypothetical protein M1480_02165 [Bacteroidetes bacterium]|nr:hypothetical protein [Bacteroidota bacterium]
MKQKFLLSIFFIIVISYSVFAQYEDTGRRGLYYAKKNFTSVPSVIPTFNESKLKLPSPILEDNKELIDLYWKAWQLAFLHFKKPPKGSPLVSNYIDEAFCPNIFQWDTIFMLMFARYAHFVFPSIQSLDNFYCRQYENGYIDREIQEANGEDFVYEGRQNTVNPPLFSWAEVENYKITGDDSRFASVIPVLEKYADWLEKYRKKENTKHGLYWQTRLGSGMDNVPRNGTGWVDMSAQMVLMYNNLSFMCEKIGIKEKASLYKDKAQNIAARINKYMWNEKDGLYYDVDDNGNQNKCKTVACFWPMLAGISSNDQAERMLTNLKDPKLFWTKIPFASLSADEKDFKPDGQYWQGSVWAPTNVEIIKGLDNYGKDTSYEHAHYFNEFASLAAEKYLEGMYKVYKTTGTIWENYSPDSYSRGLWSQPNFVGWSGCGPIELLIEDVLGFRADGANNELTWFLHRIDKHGIKNLRFGKTTATLICERRSDVFSPSVITVNANNNFVLHLIDWSGKEQTFKIHKGENKIVDK